MLLNVQHLLPATIAPMININVNHKPSPNLNLNPYPNPNLNPLPTPNQPNYYPRHSDSLLLEISSQTCANVAGANVGSLLITTSLSTSHPFTWHWHPHHPFLWCVRIHIPPLYMSNHLILSSLTLSLTMPHLLSPLETHFLCYPNYTLLPHLAHKKNTSPQHFELYHQHFTLLSSLVCAK